MLHTIGSFQRARVRSRGILQAAGTSQVRVDRHTMDLCLLPVLIMQNFADGLLPSFEIGRKVHIVRGKYKDETGEIQKLTQCYAHIKVDGHADLLKCAHTSLIDGEVDSFESKLRVEENSSKYERVQVFTDGASRGNPGKGSCAAVILDSSDSMVAQSKKFLGIDITSNVAEYEGLLLGLKLAKEEGYENVRMCLDSELVVKQATGEYKVRKPHLQGMHREAQELAKQFAQISYQHVPREENWKADALANSAIDEWESKQKE
jgi:ribonuclease HI